MMKKIFLVAILIVFILDHVFSNIEISLLPGVNLQNAILFICSVFLLITEVASGRIIKKPIPTLLLCAFIIIWCCASFFYGRLSGVVKPPPLIDHLRDFKSQLIVPIVFFILGFLLSGSEKESRANLVVIIIVFSIINFVSLTNLFGVSGGYDIQESNRFRTVLGNPNKVAYYFCLLLPFIYHLFCHYRKIAVKIFFISLLVSSAVFILLSGSRGGFICMALILLYIMLINRNYAFLAILAAVSPIVLWFLWDNANIGVTFERFAPILSGKMESSITGRFAIWGALLDVYTADFITVLYGVGASLITSVGLKTAPHNMYLKVLVEYGLVGFGIFSIFLLRIFLSIISRRSSAGSDLMPLMLLSSLVICFAWCFTTLVGMMDMVSFTYGSALAYYLHYCKPQVTKQSATRPQYIHPVEAT
jgi:O-antigen ligase